MTRRRHRRFSRLAFFSITMIGLIAVVAAVFVVLRTLPTASAAYQTIIQRTTAACTCMSTGTNWGNIGLGGGLFLLGSLALGSVLIRFMFLMVRTRKFSRSFVPLPVSRKLASVAQRLSLQDSVREVDGAQGEIFCAGMFRPKIYVSQSTLATLSEDELKTVLRHEQFHLMRLDPLRIALTDIVTVFLRWIPGLRTLYQEYRISIELAADETITERQEETPLLSAALLKLIPLRSGLATSMSGAVTFFSTTDRRIDELLEEGNGRRRSPLLIIVALVLGFSLAIGVSAMSMRVGTLNAETTQTIARRCPTVIHACRSPMPFQSPWINPEIRFASDR